MHARPPARVRVIGSLPEPVRELQSQCYVDARPVVADGRIEGLRYRREQAVSQTLHRYGSVVGARRAVS
jgi:RHH-type proline utilization regulon transcriptional repressor/proline dehydrogenase/delta 1-pyrroline-5-carboxylate dehydrogenase